MLHRLADAPSAAPRRRARARARGAGAGLRVLRHLRRPDGRLRRALPGSQPRRCGAHARYWTPIAIGRRDRRSSASCRSSFRFWRSRRERLRAIARRRAALLRQPGRATWRRPPHAHHWLLAARAALRLVERGPVSRWHRAGARDRRPVLCRRRSRAATPRPPSATARPRCSTAPSARSRSGRRSVRAPGSTRLSSPVPLFSFLRAPSRFGLVVVARARPSSRRWRSPGACWRMRRAARAVAAVARDRAPFELNVLPFPWARAPVLPDPTRCSPACRAGRWPSSRSTVERVAFHAPHAVHAELDRALDAARQRLQRPHPGGFPRGRRRPRLVSLERRASPSLQEHRVRYIGIHWDMFGPRQEEIRPAAAVRRTCGRWPRTS